MNKEVMKILRVDAGSISSEITELAIQAMGKMEKYINTLGVEELQIEYLFR